MKIQTLIILIVIFFTISCSKDPEFRGCTTTGKMCPDGSFVYRFPPDCEFAECPSQASTTTLETTTTLIPKVGHVTLNTHPLIDMDSEFTEVYILEITSSSTIHLKMNNHLYTFRVGEVDLANGKVILSASEIGVIKLNLNNSTKVDLQGDHTPDLSMELTELIDEYAELYFKRF